MKNTTKKKTSSNYTMVGICSQWAVDNEDLNGYEKSVYITIVRKSFGWGHRYKYIKYEHFDWSRGTVSKTIKSLKEKGIIDYKGTYNKNVSGRGQNEYKVLEPKNEIKNFIFTNDNKEHNANIIEIEEW